MRILYIGNFEPSFSTETHVAAGLAELGVDVVECQENQTSVAEVERLACDVDLLLYTRTWSIAGGDAAALFDRLPIPSVSYHLDLYAGLKRGAGLRDDPFWRTRYVFSADGGSQAFFDRHNVRHFWLRAGVYGRECYIADPTARFSSDVTFVGSGRYHPEWSYRGRLISWLRQTYRGRFRKWGPPEETIRGHELNQLYASAKVVVGDTLCLGPGERKTPPYQHARYWSDRVYETLGRRVGTTKRRIPLRGRA